MYKVETAPERSGWRDEGISRRHRLWGCDCCATDIDFLLIEYVPDGFGNVKNCALIEYKHEVAPEQHTKALQYLALKQLCDPAKLPLFAVRYASDFSWFLVVPLNEFAKFHLPQQKKMSEKEYVNFLYVLRGRQGAPSAVLAKLNGSSEATHD